MFLFLLFVSLLTLLLWKKFSYGILDPLVFGTIGIPLSALLIANLFSSQSIGSYVLVVFSICLLGFTLGANMFWPAFSTNAMRRNCSLIINSFSLKTVNSLIIISVFLSVSTCILALLFDGSGENRFALQKMFKPIFIIQSGMLYLSLVLIARHDLSIEKRIFYAFIIIFPNFLAYGKSLVLLFIYYWGFYCFVEKKRVNLKVIILLSLVAVSGLFLSLIIGFGVSNISQAISVLFFRLSMYGDVYIYAYQFDLLEQLRDSYSSFTSYILHPLTSIIGIKGYDYPLGSKLNSAFLGYDDIHGPNPQLPVLLDLFFQGQFLVIFVLSYLFGILSFIFRYLVCCKFILSDKYAGLFVISAAMFVPSLGFFDFSLVLMTYISFFACYILVVSIKAVCHK